MPTKRPGEVDVTADVDFGALWETVNLRMSLEESLERRLRREGRARRRGKGSDATDKAVSTYRSRRIFDWRLSSPFPKANSWLKLVLFSVWIRR